MAAIFSGDDGVGKGWGVLVVFIFVLGFICVASFFELGTVFQSGVYQ